MSALAEMIHTDFNSFVSLLHGTSGHGLADVTPATLLREDLGWDSVDMLEMLALFDAHGANLPEELIAEFRTLGDVHHYFTNLSGTAVPRHRGNLEGFNVRLAPIQPADHDYLYRLCTSGDLLTRFRLRGVTPSPEQFHRFMWDRVIAQFIVHGQNGPVGWVTSFDPDYRNRYIYVAAVAEPGHRHTAQVVEATAVLVSYLFTEFDFRKVYAETLSGNYTQFTSGAERLFEVEGRLVAHEYVNGAYEDLVTVAAHRDTWRETHRHLFAAAPAF